jgi:hypothetical protein
VAATDRIRSLILHELPTATRRVHIDAIVLQIDIGSNVRSAGLRINLPPTCQRREIGRRSAVPRGSGASRIPRVRGPDSVWIYSGIVSRVLRNDTIDRQGRAGGLERSTLVAGARRRDERSEEDESRERSGKMLVYAKYSK